MTSLNRAYFIGTVVGGLEVQRDVQGVAYLLFSLNTTSGIGLLPVTHRILVHAPHLDAVLTRVTVGSRVAIECSVEVSSALVLTRMLWVLPPKADGIPVSG